MPMRKNMSVTMPWIISALLFCLCGWMLYKLVDQSVTLDHQVQHTKLIQKQRDFLLQLADTAFENISEEQWREILDAALQKDFNFQKEEGHLVVNQVSLFFQEGRLTKISILEPMETE